MKGPRPYGWDWPLRPSERSLERMQARGFNAWDVRMMMQRPARISASPGTGRWILDSDLRGDPWRVTLDPDPDERVMVIVAAYPVRRPR